MHRSLRLSSVALSLCCAWPAFAFTTHIMTEDPYVLVKDWRSAEIVDPLLDVQVCQASTIVSQGPFPVEFSLNFPKERKAPPYILLKTPQENSALGTALVKMDAKTSHPFFPLMTSEDEAMASSLYIPLDVPRLFAKIRDEVWLDFVLDPQGSQTPVRISLKGSAATLRSMTTCLGQSTPVIPTEFFKQLNTRTELNPQGPEGTSPKDLLLETIKAFAAFEEGRLQSQSLAQLQKQMAKLVASEKSALQNFTKIDTQMSGLLQKRLESQERLSAAQNSLTRSQQELTRLESARQAAQKDLDSKTAVYLPLLEQMKPANEAVKIATQRRDRIQAEVNRLEKIIRQYPGAISSRRKEQAEMISSASELDSIIRRLQDEEDRARREVDSYNVEAEVRRQLSQDFFYRRRLEEVRDLETQASNAQRRTEQLQDEARRASRDFERCRGESRRDRGDGSTEQPAEPRDCSAEQARAENAERDFRQARQELQRLESDVWSSRRRLESIEDSARSQVQREYDRRYSDYESVREKVRSAESKRSAALNRADELTREIRNLEAELSRSRANLPGQQESLFEAERALQASETERSQLSARIGFAKAETAYLEAKNLLASLDKQIPAKKSEISKIHSAIKIETAALAKLEGQIEKLRPSHSAAGTKLQEIRSQLRPQRDQEQNLLEAFSSQKALFEGHRAGYQKIRDGLLRLLN